MDGHDPRGSAAPDFLAVAIAYAGRGIPVVALHTPTADGRCSCRCECGRDIGKHPRTLHGLSDATTDRERISSWWGMWPDANIGAATGPASGVWVLDVDAGKGGQGTIAALEATHGGLPPTWAVETGGGGLHLWFAYPAGLAIRNSVGKIGPGVDVRGEGGFVVAPPSRHASRNRYCWSAGWQPEAVTLASAPDWLLSLVTATNPRTGPTPLADGEPIAEGRRNAALASIAGTMRRRGLVAEEMLPALLAVNARRCRPPLPEAEVRQIAVSVGRYALAARLLAARPRVSMGSARVG